MDPSPPTWEMAVAGVHRRRNGRRCAGCSPSYLARGCGGVVPASWEPALNEWTGRCVDGFPICEILLVYVPFGRGKKRIIELFIGEFRVILYQSIALDETYIFVFGFGLTG